MNEEAFEQRLKETVAWCTRDPKLPKCTEYVQPYNFSHPELLPKLAKSAEYLRTPALRPSFYNDEASLWFADSKQAATAIEKISQKRKTLLADQPSMAENTAGLAGGRLLVYFLKVSNHDGLSAAITDYFDHEDSPPWDTWLCCIAGNSADYVLSWVPPVWIEDVEAVTHYEMMGAIMWFDTLVSRPEKYGAFDFHRAYIPAWLKRYTIQ